ncbi:hypothetical protein [uncultured Enterococcus sp.]|uniref:hypothetical protein n=1 Tax=uncultured Enterococcus sp. TaxID=167972 RepID=UPI0025F77136|nr:hypothetical protein [uncultured Enterococcus sp.]
MTKEEVLARLQKELELPRLTIKLDEKSYTETDYQVLKQQLLSYFEDYVRQVEN